MLTGGVGFQALLEAKGGRVVGLVTIFVGVVPLMTGVVIGSINNRMIPLASWLTAISPMSLPVYAPGSLLTIADLPVEAARAVPRAFYFWLLVAVLVVLWLVGKLWAFRRAMATWIRPRRPPGRTPRRRAPPRGGPGSVMLLF